MRFELLPNELLLELFEFINGVYLFRAFYGLNTRLDNLILLHCRTFQFNFDHVSKEDFYIICQQYLPSITDRVISIEISNDFETPKLPELFLSYAPALDQFRHLKSLTLSSIDSLQILIQITDHLIRLPNLTDFNMINCQFDEVSRVGVDLFNNIWKLPKLTHCNFHDTHEINNHLSKISIISSSIKDLSTGNSNLYSLFHILKYTPNLQRLVTVVQQSDEYSQFEPIVSSLTSLEISFSGRDAALIDIFQSLPQLHQLTLETSTINWNGYTWEEILTTNFSHLKLLQFKINEHQLWKDDNVDNLLDSFRTSFWLKKHQWFVGCQWYPHDTMKRVNIYTLPYAFSSLFYNSGYSFKSTYTDENNYYLYDSVRNFIYFSEKKLPDDFRFHFRNISELHIKNAYDPNILSWFSSLNQLTSLHVAIPKGHDYPHLQVLLDRAPNLYLLDLEITCELKNEFFQLISSSVRRLDLLGLNLNPCFTTKDCMNLISSPLGHQCEVLSIDVDKRKNVLHLIQQMSNLRSLRFQCEDDKGYYDGTNNELFYWLQNHLPSTCSFYESQQKPRRIDVWINRQIKGSIGLSTVETKVPSFPRSVKKFFKKLRHPN